MPRPKNPVLLPHLDETESNELTGAEIEQASTNGGDYMDALQDADDERATVNLDAGRGETFYEARDNSGALLANAQFTTDLATNGFVTVYRAPHGAPTALPKEHIGDYLKKPIDNTRWPELAAAGRRAFYPRPQPWFYAPPEPQFKCEFCPKMLVSDESRLDHMRGTHRSAYRLSVVREEREARALQQKNAETLANVLQILASANVETRSQVNGLLSELGVNPQADTTN